MDDQLRLLSNLGGDINIPDTYVNTPQFHEIMADLPPCRLALNSVGGESVANIARVLSNNATIVTYGGTSKRPIQISPELVAYKQLKLRGFWMLSWNATHSIAERKAMIDDIIDHIRNEKLRYLYEMHDFDDFFYALEKSQEAFQSRKIVLNMQYPDRLKEHDSLKESDYEVFDSHADGV